jgi:REP element-mobilizing transposase RayT
MEFQKRKPNRLASYDYNQAGAYFITICTQDRKCILSRIVGGGVLDAPDNLLTDVGKIVEKNILSGKYVERVSVTKYVIMPNHIHLLLVVGANTSGTSKAPSPTNALIPHFISTFKRFCHRESGERIFQRSYHDHIIRNEQDYLKIWEYIENNPKQWELDCFYVKEG